MTDFVSLDVETANSSRESICSIAVVTFSGSQPVHEWHTLVDPQTHFDDMNVSIHGIEPHSVKGAPTWTRAWGTVSDLIGDNFAVAHSSFDRVAVDHACVKACMVTPHWQWIDTCRVARRAWPQFAYKGYGLASVCEGLGIPLEHHRAESDARAAGLVLVRAMKDAALTVEQWRVRTMAPINPITGRERASYDTANHQGPLFGESLCFTGAVNIPRGVAAKMAAEAGATVERGVTRRTSILIVGDQDMHKLAGHELSNKHRKALDLIQAGQAIRIIRESDFASALAEMKHPYVDAD
jgi:DNA polymerase-3 subunit epsilon